MRRTTIISAIIAALAITAVVAPAATAKSGGGTTRTITLRGSVSFPGATGQAVSKVNGSERELEIDGEHMRALAGRHVNVNVNGHRLASPLVSSLGHFTVNRNTEAGQSVPKIAKGSTVRVRTLGGTLILSGTF